MDWTHVIELSLILACLCVLSIFAPDAPPWLVATFGGLASTVVGARIVGNAYAGKKTVHQTEDDKEAGSISTGRAGS